MSSYLEIVGTLSRTQIHKFHESKWQWHSAGRCRRSRTFHSDLGSHVHSSHIRWCFCRRSSSILCHCSRCRNCLFAFPKAVRSRRALHTAAAAVVHVRIQCCLATTPILAGGEPGMARSTYVKCGICRSIYIFPGLITPHLPHMAHQS